MVMMMLLVMDMMKWMRGFVKSLPKNCWMDAVMGVEMLLLSASLRVTMIRLVMEMPIESMMGLVISLPGG
jgi:hypothetical protein